MTAKTEGSECWPSRVTLGFSEQREPVIPTGAGRFFLSHDLCAPGCAAEGPWQDYGTTFVDGTKPLITTRAFSTSTAVRDKSTSGWQTPGVVYHAYILASASGVLYTGVTSGLERRVAQHKQGLFDGFSKEYEVTRLVYFEGFGDIRDTISREKQIKRWRREKKLALIRMMNPKFRDLSGEFPH